MKLVHKAMLILGLIALGLPGTGFGEQRPPSALEVKNFSGGNITIRHRDLRPQAISNRAQLARYDDVLFIPGDNTSYAQLVAVDNSPYDYDGLMVQAGKSSQNSEYIFPCQGSGHLLLSWRPAGTLNERSCWDGVAVNRHGQPFTDRLPSTELADRPIGKARSDLLAANGEGMVIVPDRSLTFVRTDDAAGDLVVDVIFGGITVRSDTHPAGRSISAGQRYNYDQDSVEPIDLVSILNSAEIQSFLNPRSWQTSNISNRAEYGIAEHLAQAGFEAYMQTVNAVRTPVTLPEPTVQPTPNPRVTMAPTPRVTPTPTPTTDRLSNSEDNGFDQLLGSLLGSIFGYVVSNQPQTSTPIPASETDDSLESTLMGNCSLTGSWEYRSPDHHVYEESTGFEATSTSFSTSVYMEESEANINISNFLRDGYTQGVGNRDGNLFIASIPIDEKPIGLNQLEPLSLEFNPLANLLFPSATKSIDIPYTMVLVQAELKGFISSDQQRIQGDIIFSDGSTGISETGSFMMSRLTQCP